MEVELNKMISLQNSQNSELAKMQNRLTKAYGVEETCKRQEIVIEKLETLIKKLMLERKSGIFFFQRSYNLKNFIMNIYIN